MRRHFAVVLATLLITAGVFGATAVSADVSGDFRGAADADLLEVSAVSLPPGCGDEGLPLLGEVVPCTFELAQLVLGDSEAGVSSAGDTTYDGTEGLSAYGHGSNLDPDLLNAGGTEGSISEDLLVRSDALQPGGEATDSDQLAAFPDNPLLALELATTEASAVDVTAGANTSCPDVDENGRATLAHGRNELLGLRLAPDALGEGQDLVATQDPEQISYAESTTDIVDGLHGAPDDGVYGLESTARVQAAPVVLFGGQIHVEVSTPELIGRHDGSEFSIEYRTPVVTVNGETVVDGEMLEPLDQLDLPGNPVLNLQVGIANTEDIEIDGTSATVSDVVTLDLILGDPETDMSLGVASLSLGDLTVAAQVGPDGITLPNCGPETPEEPGDDLEDPLREVAKDVSAARVAPGGTFDYVISVPNRGECTLTDVVVTDTVTGPMDVADSSTSPQGTVEGSTVTWTLDELAPNETAVFTITVAVPDDTPDGTTYSDDVDVTADCDGEPVDGDDAIIDIPVVDAPEADGCDLSGSNKSSSHTEVFPGESFSYFVHAVNGGTEDCGAVTVTDTLPEGVVFEACSDDCTSSGRTVTWELAELASGDSRTLVVTVTAPDEPIGEHLPNTAVLDPENGPDTTVTDDGPVLDEDSVLRDPDPGDFPPADTGGFGGENVSMPRTGGGAGLAALGLLGLAGALRRRSG